MSISRNAACPCGSGKKYKECCGALDRGGAVGKVESSYLPEAQSSELILRDGWQHQVAGRLQDAVKLYEQVLRIEPNNSDALNLLGLAAMQGGRADIAVGLIEKATSIRPMAAYYNNLGNAQKALEWVEVAARSYRRALDINPEYAKAHNNLGVCLKDLGQFEDAAAHFCRAVELEPDLAEAHLNLGNVKNEQERFDEAIGCLEHALALKPDYAAAHCSLGIALAAREGTREQATRHFEQAIALAPELAQAHWQLANILLIRGEIERGWREFGWRTKAFPNLRRPVNQALWAGESLTGKNILVWGEQGLGDEMMYASVLPDVLKSAHHVVLECDPRLVRLFSCSFPGVEVIPRTEPPHPRLLDASIDYQTPSGSLPRWFRPSLESFPIHDGYLRPDLERVYYWKQWLDTLGSGRKIGICWRSMRRSADRDNHYTKLEQWSEILLVSGLVFINLQYDDCGEEIELAQQQFGVRIHQPPGINLKDDLDEVAALTRALELVVSAGTSVVGMAGAVGIPAWMFTLDYNWTQLGTGYLPWMPSVKLFCKSRDIPWEPVLGEIAQDLAQLNHAGEFVSSRLGPEIHDLTGMEK